MWFNARTSGAVLGECSATSVGGRDSERNEFLL